MVHELSQYAYDLPAIEEWIGGDDRVLAFAVVDADGNTLDISSYTLRWRLFERAYQTDQADAVLDEADSTVTVSTTDAANGKWEVEVDGDATDGEWGRYYHRPEIEQTNGDVASWRGTVILTE